MNNFENEEKFYYIMVIENVKTGEIKTERFYIFDKSMRIAKHEAAHIFMGFRWNGEIGWRLVAVMPSACSIATNGLS